jgi:hypothetical protein
MAPKTPTPTDAKPATALQIFKPGRHVAMSGQTLAFTESDLQATVAAYDPTKHEAPLVVGHPAHDMPAYGWVQALAFTEGGIDATPAQVNTDFADMVAAGAYKKISAAFYSPRSPANPVPGVYYLRHVGFLGAAAPAVKGMRSPQFAELEEGVVEFSEWDDATNASLWRSLREWFIGAHGAEVADKVLPAYDVRSLEQGAQDEIRDAAVEAAVDNKASAEVATPQFTDPQPQEPTVTPEQKAALEAENTRLRTELAAHKAAQLHAANAAFCEGLPGVLPAWRAVAVATLDHLDALPVPVEFGEGEQKAPLAAQLKAMFAALPPVVQFGEQATKARAADADDAPLAFAAPTGYTVDAAALARHHKALAHQKANGGTYMDAVLATA